jgi:hypothetical protein
VNELGFQNALRSKLTKRRPTGVWFKHRDETTSGMPDVSWTDRCKVWWLELKVADQHGSFKVKPRQVTTMCKLWNTNPDRTWFIVRERDGRVTIHEPYAVKRWLVDDGDRRPSAVFNNLAEFVTWIGGM